MTRTTTRTRPVVLIMDGYGGSNVARAIARAGGDVITISPYSLDAIDKIAAADFDAVVLTGGGDVDPRLYGAKPHRETYGVNETRDETELAALDAARDRNVPILGICRGSQLMAVHNGGALRQHISGHSGVQHSVFPTRNAKLGRTAGMVIWTVSLHHQVVKDPGKGFRVAALSKGGNIEAIESTDGRCLGVQWHPEIDQSSNASSRKIFGWLVNEAARRAGMTTPVVRPIAAAQTVTPMKSKKGKTKKAPIAKPVVPDTLPGMSVTAPRKPRRASKAVMYHWYCRECGMLFDDPRDRDDHELFICGNA